MRITGINNNANGVRVINHGTRFTKAGLLAYARNVNAAKYADIGTDKSILTHGIDGGSMSIKHKKPERKEHTLFITQTLPQCDSSPLMDDEYLHNIIAMGNRNFNEFNHSEWGHIYTAIVDGDLLDELESYDWYGYKNRTEMISEYLDIEATPYQVGKLRRLCEKWTGGHCCREDIIAEVLTLFTPYTWKSSDIAGYCQGDWADIVYPTELYTTEDIDLFEAYFFGKFMDYRADYNGEEIWFTFTDYTEESDIINEISNNFGANKVKYFPYF